MVDLWAESSVVMKALILDKMSVDHLVEKMVWTRADNSAVQLAAY